MAVEAARDCVLDNAQAPADLVLASTTLPYADRDNAAVVVEALGLNEQINTLDMTASLARRHCRAGQCPARRRRSRHW